MRHISSDPYARTTLVRRNDKEAVDCAYCGQKPLGKRTLFNYGTQYPNASVEWSPRAYCSKSCMIAFRGH